MCHGQSVSLFPEPGTPAAVGGEAAALAYGDPGAATRLAILPDVFGCTPFYRGLAAYLAGKGARVFLMNPFADLGELSEPTLDAAFARRSRLHDFSYLDRFEGFALETGIRGTIGFCLGGLYILELARRSLPGNLVAYYPFPQNLPNQDPVPTPFDYLETLQKPVTVLVGDSDTPVGPANVGRMAEIAARNPAFTVHVYPGSEHGFLADIDSVDPVLRANARNALMRGEAAAFAG